MSQRLVLRIASHFLTMAAVLSGRADRAQAIRYELIDGAGGEQGGHTLAGFIEFDSPCGGNCTAASITDFTFSVSGPSTYSYSYQTAADAFLDAGQLGQPFLYAGPANLIVDYSAPGTLTLANAAEGSRPYIQWYHALSSYYSSAGPNIISGWGSFPPFFSPVVIGVVVPEPATVAIVFWGSVVSFLVARNRELGFTKNEGVANHVSC